MDKPTIEAIYPLAPMQHGMLFHSIYEPGSAVYSRHMTCALHGDLNVWAFKRAWDLVAARQPILRTLFSWERRDKPLQVVLDRVVLPWQELDWRDLAADEQHEQLAAFLQADCQRGFDLAKLPLVRLTLIRMTNQAHLFVFSFHHILLDGWSLSLLLKEVFIHYECTRLGYEADMERPRLYRDYITWLQQQDMPAAERFWRQTLKGFTAPTPLVVDRASEIAPGAVVSDERQLYLPATITAALQSLARQQQLTLNTMVQGAWALLLSRYSGEEDVVFGSVGSGRPTDLAGVQTMVGLFINTLPVRVQVPPKAALLDWLKAFQAQQAELRQYEYTPLVQIQSWSEIPNDIPLFESILVYESYPMEASLDDEIADLEIRDLRTLERTNYPLSLMIVPGKELLLRLFYDTRRFEAATIERMLEHLCMLLEGIAARPQQRLADLPLLTGAERQTMLVDWNATQTDFPWNRCAHELFETVVEQTPEAIALVFEDQQITYRDLNRRANQLAHELQSLGVGPDALVGICMDRSIEMIVAALGVLKAGGAYVPLDPTYPQERLTFMLEDSQVAVLLTHHQHGALSTHHAAVLDLDTAWETIARRPDSNPSSLVTADHAAYVIYTSGSTGRPKGVVLAHRGICNLATAQRQIFNVGPGNRVLQFASLSFDASVWEICMALFSGATLCLAPHKALFGAGAGLAQTLRDLAVDVATLPPSLLAVLSADAVPNLTTIISAGESCSDEIVARWAPGRRFFNAYGPTESTVCASLTRCTDADGGRPSIGRPIANTAIYILDRHGNPVPIGVPGELHIGGIGLARGYHNRPELTAEKFTTNPFVANDAPPAAPQAGYPVSARLYKTGDLARYQPDGNIEFLGRIDDQVKIRGFRIELGEIEAALRQHPAIQDATVVAREDVPGQKRLVAYIVPANRQPAATDQQTEASSAAVAERRPQRDSELRDFLKARLPEYMVPTAFVTLGLLPMTPSGKVDRRALPAPEKSQPGTPGAAILPRNETERALAAIWQDALQIEQVDVNDNFFELGGHSLLMSQVHGRLVQAFNRDIPMVSLFQHPTISALATYLNAEEDVQPALTQVADRAAARRDSLQRRRLRKEHSALL